MSQKTITMLRYFEMTLLHLDQSFINQNLDIVRLLGHFLQVDPFFYYVATGGDTLVTDSRETYDPFLNYLDNYDSKNIFIE